MLFRAWKKIALLIAWFVLSGCVGRSSNDISDNPTNSSTPEISQVSNFSTPEVTDSSGNLHSTENTTVLPLAEPITAAVNEPGNEVDKDKTTVNVSDVNNGVFHDNEDYDQMKIGKSDSEIATGESVAGMESPLQPGVDPVVTEGTLSSSAAEGSANNDDVLPDEIADTQSKENEIMEKLEHPSGGYLNSTSANASTAMDSAMELNNDTTLFSSPLFFTRAYQFQSISIYDDEVESDHFSSGKFPDSVYPYGSRFQLRPSSFLRGISFTEEVTPSWRHKTWPTVYTTSWVSPHPTSSCTINTCDYGSIFGDLSSPIQSHLLESHLTSLFPETRLGYRESSYDSEGYFEPTYQSYDVLRSSSQVMDLPIYTSNDGMFGMRITPALSPSLATVRTSFGFREPHVDLYWSLNPTLDISPVHTVTVGLSRNRKLSDGANSQLSFHSSSHFPNDHWSVENTRTTSLRTMKIDNSKSHNFGMSISSSLEAELSPFFPAPSTTTHKFADSRNTNADFLSSSSEYDSSRVYSSPAILPSHSSMFSSSRMMTFPIVMSSLLVSPHNSRYSSTEHFLRSTESHGSQDFSFLKDLEDTDYEKNAIQNSKDQKQLKYELQDQSQANHSNNLGANIAEYNSSESSPDRSLYYVDSRDVSYFPESSRFPSFTTHRSNEIAPTPVFHLLSSPTPKPTTILADDEDSSKLLSYFYDELMSYDNGFILSSSFSKTPYYFSSHLRSQDFVTPFLKLSDVSVRTTSITPPRPNVSETELVFGNRVAGVPNASSTSFIHLNMPTFDIVRPFQTQESSIFHYVSSSYPHLMSLLVERNKTHVSGIERPTAVFYIPSTSVVLPSRTRKDGDPSVQHPVPPPRITNPNCNTLPICIAVTIGMSWKEFCPNVDNFRKFLAESLSQYTRPIRPDQIIFSSDHHECKTSGQEENNDLRILRRRRNASTIVINIYITDSDGEYDDKLTEICGVILKIWMPTSGTPFQNRVMEVKLFHIEEEAGVPASIPSEPPTSTGIIAAITISTIAGACLVLLCILLVVMKQRLLQNRNCNPALDAYSLDSFSINASFRRRRIRQSMRSFLNHAFDDPELPSHPLSESGLMNILRNTDVLEEEFKKLPMNMPKLDQIPTGAEVKNRYANVFPNPETRVILSAPEDDPIKEYINANYVKSYDGKPRAYIATQAPLPETVEDFWKMIWEQQSRVILMITMLEENGMQRCATYFPESTLDCHKLYGDYQVSLQKKDIREFYTMSTFRLYNLEVKKNLFREVVHFWFTSWPTTGVPSDPGSLVTFLLQARPYIKCNSGPTVVHCSPGTGRTGVVLALDMTMREYEESRSVDLFRCLARVRRDRGGAVQNKEQYILLHEAMAEYVSNVANQSHRPSIRSNS